MSRLLVLVIIPHALNAPRAKTQLQQHQVLHNKVTTKEVVPKSCIKR